MDVDVETGLLVLLVEQSGELDNVLVLSSVCQSGGGRRARVSVHLWKRTKQRITARYIQVVPRL